MNQPNLAPVVLFVYGRPIHTQRTIDALLQNPESKDTDLIVYSDGPKQHNDTEKVESVREIIKKTSGFKSIKLIERTENLGLAANIIDGVTKVCEEYGKVIVLEDDLETSPFFLNYMNTALNFHENNNSIISISGFSYPIEFPQEYTHDTYLLRIPLCWGWATWKSKWDLFEKNISAIDKVSPSLISYINFNNTHDFFSQAIENKKGKINTWFIFWYISSVTHKKFTVYPKHTLVKNIGYDGTGENCDDNDILNSQDLYNKKVYNSHLNSVEDKLITRSYEVFFKKIRKKLLTRVFNKLKRIVNGIEK